MQKKKTTGRKTKKSTAKKAASKPKLNKARQNALDALKIAIQTEIDGYNFYTLAAQRTRNADGKKMFEFLAGEETKHREILEQRYRNLFGGEPFGKLPKPTKVPRSYKTKSPIFSAEFSNRAKLPGFEMTALSIGILLEEKSIKFFNDLAGKTRNPETKKFFKGMADWEGEHLKLLMHQHNLLMKEYWREARFEPLF